MKTKLLRLLTGTSIIAVMLFFGALPIYGEPASGYVRAEEGYIIPTPLGYSVVRVINGDYQYGMFKNPEDLFIDNQNQLYVADTDNNRIVKMNAFGKIIGVFGTKKDQLNLKKPKGIYVEQDGDMYVADTNNARIVHLASDGTFIEEFLAPESELIDNNFPFSPEKLVIDSRGYMYVQSGNDYHGLMMIDGNNKFQGYIAPNKLRFDLGDWIKRIFATKDQRDVLGKKVPPNHRNVDIDLKEGYLYTAIQNTTFDEIKRFNFLGLNTYPVDRSFGEYSGDSGLFTAANVVDITVDHNGIITTVDSNHKKVYQYDQEGNMLIIFGDSGGQKGFFQEPISVDVDSEGLVYILDRSRGQIQVFKANDFTELVHQASSLYNDGRYEEAMEPWKQVLRIDSNYNLAHRGVGKALYKQEQWPEALEQFRLGEDKANYSKAYAEYRHDIIRKHFGWIIFSATLLLVSVYFMIIYLNRYARKIENAGLSSNAVDNGVLILFAPREGFSRIQLTQSYIPFAVLLFGVIAARFFEIYFTSFHFSTLRPEFANLFLEASKIVIPMATWIVAAWAITSIMDGQSRLKEIAFATAYAMIPYIIGTVAKTLLSNVLTHEEFALWGGIFTFIWIWLGLIFFIKIMVMNDYSLGRTIWVIIVTMFTMIAIWAVCSLFYMLLNHVFNFFKELVLELYIRRY